MRIAHNKYAFFDDEPKIRIEPAQKTYECYGCLELIRPGEVCEVRFTENREIGRLCPRCRHKNHYCERRLVR